MTKQKKERIQILNIQYFSLQMLFWGAAVVNYAYMTQLLEYKGFTEVEIGILNSVKLLSGVGFQLWIGPFVDRHIYKIPLKYIIALLTFITALLSLDLYFVQHYFTVMFMIAVGFGFSFTTISPLLDSLSMLYTNQGYPINYALGRAGGSISWAVFCICAGLVCDTVGIWILPILQLLFALAMTCLILSMKWISPNKKKEKADFTDLPVHTVKALLCEYPKYSMFLIASAIMFMGYNLGTTFLIDVVMELGGTSTQYGEAQFVMAISEVPAAFLIMRCRKKIPMDRIMLCCAICMTLKNVFPTYTDSVNVVIISQLCEMLGFGLFYSGSVYIVAEMLPKQDVVKGMVLVSVATVGCGEGVASFICGIIKRVFTLHGLMESSVLVSSISVVIMGIMCMIKKQKKYT